jgi:hypothetical protein
VVEQLVVHRPELALAGSGLGGLARELRMRGARRSGAGAECIPLFVSLIGIAAYWLTGWPARKVPSNPVPASRLRPLQLTVAAIGNRVAGAIAAVGAAVWFDCFFTLPYERFTIRSSADVTTFVLLLVAGVIVSQLAAYARRLKVVAITDAGYLAHIHQAAALTQTAKSPGDVVDHVRWELIAVLDLQECRFEYGGLLGHPPRLEPDGTALAARARWDVEQAGLPAEEIELRVFGGGQYHGRFIKPKPGSRPSLQARLVAVTLADQAGRALAAGTPSSSGR